MDDLLEILLMMEGYRREQYLSDIEDEEDEEEEADAVDSEEDADEEAAKKTAE